MAPRPRDRGAPTAAKSANPPPKLVRCIPCQVSFASNETYEAHLLQSANHFACVYCLVNHHTAEALKRHMNQMHSAEQKLQCPGCRKSFNRLGGLMSHIEYKDCQFLKLGYVKELRAQDPRNSGKFEAIRAAFAWGSTEVASVQRQLNDCPAVKDAQASADISAGPSSLPRKQDTSDDQFVQAFVRNKVAEEEDLISFDAPALVLNASWDQPTVLNSAVDFHASVPVENKTSPAKVQNKSNDSSTNVRTPFNNLKTRIPATPVAAPITTVPAWDTSYAGTPTSATLFPNARPAIVPPTALMESLSVTAPSAQPIYDEHDPNDPNFNASRYYNNFARSYKCPHRGCKKNMPSASAFIQHLRSPLHMKLDKVKCPQCLRPFSSATALTQHIESQTIRCGARKLKHAGVIVENITQVATTDGFHDDETVKYVNLPDRFANTGSAVAAVVEASRRAVDAQVDIKENHWRVHTYGNW